MAKYKVVEIFKSINGEGKKSGQLTIFVRFQKCNLCCAYCDTKWAIKEDAPYILMTDEEIYNTIIDSGVKNVTLTGGEPLIQYEIEDLLLRLAKNKELNVEIETNGSISIEKLVKIENGPSFTMDYKLPASQMEEYMFLDNFKYLRGNDTIKFVAMNINDLERVKEIVNNYKLIGKCNIYLSPVFGEIDLKEMVEFMKKNNMNGVTLQLQIHKIIWDPEERGV